MEAETGIGTSNFVRCRAVAEAVLRTIAGQLKTADLSPHEGRLRRSVIPSKYIEVPDFVPMHDDTIPPHLDTEED